MEPATAALIARAAIAAGTNKKVWTGIASVLAALCLPVILAVMCYISIASGGTEHNRAAVHLAFDGGEAPDGMPADYQAYVRQMQESFAELDAILDDIDGMTEGEVCDRYLVKSVFYSLYFGADRVRLETDDYKKFADCFVDYEERTQNIEQEDGTVTLEKYTVELPLGIRQKSSKNLHPTMESPQLMNNSPMQSMCGMWQSMTRQPRQRGMNFPTGAAGTGQGLSLCMICRPTGMGVISYSLHYQDWGIRTRRHSAEPGIMSTAVT